MAITSLVAGFAGIVVPVLGGLLAVVSGIVALVQVNRPDSFKKGTAMAIVGICLGLLTTVGWVLLLSSEAFQEGLAEGFEEAAQETSTSRVLAVGDCLDIPTDDSQSFLVSADDVVPCTNSHTAEYIGSPALPESAEYPGEDEVFYQAVDRCLDVFVDYTGFELAEYADLDIFVEYPRSVHWRLNDRETSCFVINLDGRASVGSVRD